MPTRLPGRRARGGAGILKAWEKDRIAGWLIEGYSVMEVYGRCLDYGIEPPQEQAIYRILNSEAVQAGLRDRKAEESKNRIASIAARTSERQEILNRLKITVKERADEYAGFVAGGASGLIVLSDKKTIRTSETDYDTVDIYKTDGVILENWRGVLSDQEKSDAALRRNLREERDRTRVDERHEQESDIRELTIAELRAKIEALEAEKARRETSSYQAPSFSEFIVEKLPAPDRPEVKDVAESEQDEGATPEIPWILEDEEKTASQEPRTEALE